jgi:hypothetical protein
VSSDTIRVEARDGRQFDFDNPDPQFHPFADGFNILGPPPSGSGMLQLAVARPPVNDVPLTYMRMATFILNGPPGETIVTQFVFGAHTRDMPNTGAATYSAIVSGSGTEGGTETYVFNLESEASLTANFANGTVSTLLHLVGAPVGGGESKDFGEFTGSGVIAQNAFQGLFETASGGGFWGSFFGPKAEEMGYGYDFNDATFASRGLVVGRKN